MDDTLSRRGLIAALLGASATSAAQAQAGVPRESPPLLRTANSQYTELRPRLEVPALTLERVDGKRLVLTALRGKVVLVNFWATWCPPCRRELPVLENLQRTTSPEGLAIVAVSIDQAGRPAVEAFLKRLNITRLRPFLDPLGRIAKPAGGNAMTPFVLWGMPISYIIDRQGHLAGYITGEVEWTSAQARAFLNYYAND